MAARRLGEETRFPGSFFIDKRARASNARPYKRFLTAWGEQCSPESLMQQRF